MLSMTASCAVPVTACIKYVGARGGADVPEECFDAPLQPFLGRPARGRRARGPVRITPSPSGCFFEFL